MAIKPRERNLSSVAGGLAHMREVEARVLAGAYGRIHASVERAKQLGLIDDKGNLLLTDLPDDMQPGVQRDVGS